MSVKPGQSVKYTVLEFLGKPFPPIGTRQTFDDYDEAVRYAINAHYQLDTELFVYRGTHRGEQEPKRHPITETCACPQRPEPVHLIQDGCGYPVRRTA